MFSMFISKIAKGISTIIGAIKEGRDMRAKFYMSAHLPDDTKK